MRRKAAILPGINESRRIVSFVDQMMPASFQVLLLFIIPELDGFTQGCESSEDGRASLEMRQFFWGAGKRGLTIHRSIPVLYAASFIGSLAKWEMGNDHYFSV